jgi:hypothetical protein
MRNTVPLPAPTAFATFLMPSPTASRARTAASTSALVFGRPRRTPRAPAPGEPWWFSEPYRMKGIRQPLRPDRFLPCPNRCVTAGTATVRQRATCRVEGLAPHPQGFLLRMAWRPPCRQHTEYRGNDQVDPE